MGFLINFSTKLKNSPEISFHLYVHIITIKSLIFFFRIIRDTCTAFQFFEIFLRKRVFREMLIFYNTLNRFQIETSGPIRSVRPTDPCMMVGWQPVTGRDDPPRITSGHGIVCIFSTISGVNSISLKTLIKMDIQNIGEPSPYSVANAL